MNNKLDIQDSSLNKIINGKISFWVNIIQIITLWLFFFDYNEVLQYIIEFGTIIYLGMFAFFNLSEPYNKTSILLLLFGILFIIVIFFIPHLDLNTNFEKQYQGYLGSLIKTGNYHRSSGVYLRYKCGDKNRTFTRDVSAPYGYNDNADDYRIVRDLKYAVISIDGKMLEVKISPSQIKKYTNSVLYARKRFVELGNDSYEYAKYERDITFKNYGFNLVFKAYKNDTEYAELSFFERDIKHLKLSQEMKTLPDGEFLVYTNINPDIYDGWHVCPDSLCTSENYDKVLEGGYGYLFRGKIYSKEETEKYWNIIEQYKLRNANEN